MDSTFWNRRSPARQTSPCSYANAAAAVRELTSILTKILLRCRATVFSLSTKVAGDLGVAPPRGDQPQYFHLARGEARRRRGPEPAGRSCSAGRPRPEAGELPARLGQLGGRRLHVAELLVGLSGQGTGSGPPRTRPAGRRHSALRLPQRGPGPDWPVRGRSAPSRRRTGPWPERPACRIIRAQRSSSSATSARLVDQSGGQQDLHRGRQELRAIDLQVAGSASSRFIAATAAAVAALRQPEQGQAGLRLVAAPGGLGVRGLGPARSPRSRSTSAALAVREPGGDRGARPPDSAAPPGRTRPRHRRTRRGSA